MKIAYTVCSLNRLGQILVLGKSLLQYNPEYRFIIGLADEEGERLPASYEGFEFISLSAIHLDVHEKITTQYDIFELSCALKAYYGRYILAKYQPDQLFYFDTDMAVYHSLAYLETELEQYSILLTPHYLAPVPEDGKYPMERDVLNSGLYNGGFFAVKNDATGKHFFEWWCNRLADQGYNNVSEGMMVDQLWLNLVPLFFKDVLIVSHAGCNFAYWNMHERLLTEKDGALYVNEQPLLFYHFSGYRVDQPQKISIHQNRFQLGDNTAVKKLITAYHQQLVAHGFEQYLALECVYGKPRLVKKHSLPKRIVMGMLLKTGYKLEKVRNL